MLHQIFNGVCDYKYENILLRLNFLILNLRRKLLDAIFLINVVKGKISCSFILDTVSLRIPTRALFPKVWYAYHRWYAKGFQGVCGREILLKIIPEFCLLPDEL
jgi:hypothetical protein